MKGLEGYVGLVLDEKYRLESLLGQGGMGAVYLATHLGTERFVALKLIAPQFMRNEEFVERFKREARAAGRLRHPNVVDVTDFGFARVEGERVAYLVMEYLDGCTLGDVLAEERRLPLDWVVDILEQVSSAVGEAHRQGVVHRDLKPDNIWLEPNRLGSYRVKVLDFGIAKLAEADAGVVTGEGNQLSSTRPSNTLGASSLKATDSNAQVPPHTSSQPPSRTPSHEAPHTPSGLESDTLLMPPGGGGERGDERGSEQVEQLDASTLMWNDASRDERDSAPPGESQAGRNESRAGENEATAREAATQLFAPSQTEHPAASTGQQGAAAATRRETEDDGTLLMDGQPTRGLVSTAGNAAAATAASSGLTRIGAIMGTPAYMSPEQCRGERLDARSDIYSLGVIAYQMLAGDAPFEGDMLAVMRRHKEEEPPPLREKNRKVPKSVARVVEGALSKDPSARPQTADAFANSLRANADGVGALYRRAFALYSEHFPKFLYMSFVSHLPVIVITLLVIAVELAEKSLPKVFFVVAIVLLVLLQVVAYFVAASAITGLTSLVVAQLYVAPLRPVQLGNAFAVLRRRWRPFLSTSFRVTVRIMLGWICFIVPGLVMTIRYLLYAPVVLMEGLEKREAMRRARELASRSWRTVIIVSLLQFMIPIVVSALLGRFSVHRSSPGEANVSAGIAQQLTGLVNIVVVPLMSIVPALLYLKMRRMGGEAVSDTITQIEEVEAARSDWQRRMRTRLTVSLNRRTSVESGAGSEPDRRIHSQ